MPDLNKVFGDYSPESIKAATNALSWVAEEIANSNNFTKEQTEILKKLLQNNEDLQIFFTTEKPDGFSAMRNNHFQKQSEQIIQDMLEPIRKIVRSENKKIWTTFTIVLTALLGILTFIFNWIQENHIETLVKDLL